MIGINTAIYSPNGGSVGIGFAIPASLAAGVVEQLEDNGPGLRAVLQWPAGATGEVPPR